MTTLKYFQYTPDELAADFTGQTHRAFEYAARNGYITKEQLDELLSTTVVTAINNKPGFGRRILDRLFSKEDKDDSWRYIITTIEKD